MSFSSKLKEFKNKNSGASPVTLVYKIVSGSFRILSSKYYLRKCTKIGKWVSVKGRPLVRNSGVMILEDEVRVWSSIEKAKLFSGPDGKLIIGKNSRINGAHISAQLSIKIGKNVRIAPYTLILDSDFHDINNHFSDGVSKEIVIEDDVWLASRSTVLKGVRIGKGAVVATGAVVTKDVPEFTVVAGVPAKAIKKLHSK
ncbi:MAG: acyltransferase [Bacteroidota bacterium]